MQPETILWIYIAMLMLGGLVGFLKAKSRISLVTSFVFSVVLSLCALNKLPIQVAWGVLSFLALFFLIRFLKTRKFMPGGMMTLLSFATIIAVVWFKS